MIDPLTIMAVIEKGLGIANMLIEAGRSAKPAIDALLGLTKAQQEGGVKLEDLEALEAQLDKLMEDFNEPLPN